ncbi:hypothetical protein CAter282_4259 [Collimonas arenae]|uniref:Uncharacterized protein n=1 Tax=Collimonas arenae TaxID=279058 RepID=A0A127PXC0_9BURK|nr:hypothetical protein CAter10_4632 [Collimonas arenae]AMP11919.1 hypothetical protein CAter282_4259 [Collimonas arenae]
MDFATVVETDDIFGRGFGCGRRQDDLHSGWATIAKLLPC